MIVVGEVHGEINIEGLPNYHFEQALTEEDIDMARDELARLVGDGNARLSVSRGMKDADYGRSYSVHVTVSLACHQEAETLREGHSLADDLAQEFVQLSFEEAQELYKSHGLHEK